MVLQLLFVQAPYSIDIYTFIRYANCLNIQLLWAIGTMDTYYMPIEVNCKLRWRIVYRMIEMWNEW